MNVSIKDIDQCLKEITITVASDEAMNDYRSVLAKFKNYVAVPGFRKGKAPLSMVENLFADQAKEAYLKEKVYDYYEAAIKENEIEPINEGMPVSVDWEKGSDLVMVFRYEVKPNVVIEKYTGLEIPAKLAEFNDRMVDDTIEDLKNKMSEDVVSEEPAQEGNIISAIISNPEENDKEARKDQQDSLTEITLGDNDYGEEFNKALSGCKAGDKIETVRKSKDNDGVPVVVEVKDVKKRIYPEINDALAKEVGFDSLEALRSDIEKNLRSRLETENLQRKKTLLIARLIKENPFDIPPSSVLYYSHKLAEPYAKMLKKKPEDLAEYYRETAFFEIKTFFITKYLIDKLDLQITEEDESALIREMAEELNLSIEEYKEKNPDVTKNDDFVNRMKEKKIFEFLFENNKFVEEVEEESEKEDSQVTEKK